MIVRDEPGDGGRGQAGSIDTDAGLRMEPPGWEVPATWLRDLRSRRVLPVYWDDFL